MIKREPFYAANIKTKEEYQREATDYTAQALQQLQAHLALHPDTATAASTELQRRSRPHPLITFLFFFLFTCATLTATLAPQTPSDTALTLRSIHTRLVSLVSFSAALFSNLVVCMISLSLFFLLHIVHSQLQARLLNSIPFNIHQQQQPSTTKRNDQSLSVTTAALGVILTVIGAALLFMLVLQTGAFLFQVDAQMILNNLLKTIVDANNSHPVIHSFFSACALIGPRVLWFISPLWAAESWLSFLLAAVSSVSVWYIVVDWMFMLNSASSWLLAAIWAVAGGCLFGFSTDLIVAGQLFVCVVVASQAAVVLLWKPDTHRIHHQSKVNEDDGSLIEEENDS